MPILKICLQCGAKQSEALCTNCKRERDAARPRLGSEHTAIRRELLASHPRCLICARPATQADHVIPRAKGGATTPANYVALCASCNAGKGASELGEYVLKRIRRGQYVVKSLVDRYGPRF